MDLGSSYDGTGGTMYVTRSVAVGLGIVALGLGFAACTEGNEPTSPPSIESSAGPQSIPSTTPDGTAAGYHVVLDVGYRQTLRFPGSGHIPRELEFDYAIDTSASVGKMADPAVQGTVAPGTASWAIRCFGDSLSDPVASPIDEQSGTQTFAVGTADSSFPNPEALEAEVDWLAGPGVLLLEQDGALLVAQRLPSSIALDQTVDTECTDSISALTVNWGHGAMTAPARVNKSGVDYTWAEALNLDQELPVYVLDQAGDGWLLAVIPLDAFGPGPQSIDFLREESEPEGETRLQITGTIERNNR